MFAGLLLLCSTVEAVPPRDAIFQAVCDGDLAAVQELIDRWPRCVNDIPELNLYSDEEYRGLSPFLLAVEREQRPIIDYMLQFAEINHPRREEIFSAVCDGELLKVKALVTHWPRCVNDGSDPHGENGGMTPFQLAMTMGEEEMVGFMLRRGDVNFFRREPRRGDNALLLALRLSGYTRIMDAVLAHLEQLHQTLPRRIRKILEARNNAREDAFSLTIRTNVTNKAAVLRRLLRIGLIPTWVPFESFGEYHPHQLPTNPLYALQWQGEWEAFCILAEHYPVMLFFSIESIFTTNRLRRFKNQSVIMRLLRPDTFTEFQGAVEQYGQNNPFLQLVCGDMPRAGQELAPELTNDSLQSSEGRTPLDIIRYAVKAYIWHPKRPGVSQRAYAVNDRYQKGQAIIDTAIRMGLRKQAKEWTRTKAKVRIMARARARARDESDEARERFPQVLQDLNP
ncbi:MAG: hypothetical protein LBD54_00570 [Puniceicoccales bacterium]|nr:hypothetical protein [Puniceicoccales bacterium]